MSKQIKISITTTKKFMERLQETLWRTYDVDVTNAGAIHFMLTSFAEECFEKWEEIDFDDINENLIIKEEC